MYLLAVVAVFLLARYAAAPLTGFVLDDWNYLRFAGMYENGWELAKHGFAKDLNRPLSTMVMALGFYQFGLTLWPYMLLLMLGHLLVLLLAVALVYRWNGGNVRATFLFGMAYAVLPLLTESYYFPMLAFVMAVVGLPFYLFSAYGITRYAEDGRSRWLWLAWVPYGVNLFWYEAGILLPAAFAVLLVGRQPWRRVLFALSGYAVFFLLYFSWRSTDAFGLLQSTTPEHMKASGAGVEALVVNGKEFIRWWAADRGILVWRQGLEAFSGIPLPRRVFLVLVNLGMVLGLAVLLKRLPKQAAVPASSSALSLVRLICFCAVWFAVTSVPALMSYVVGRLLVLPAIAAVCVASVILAKVSSRWLIGLGAPLLFAAILADQGTNQSWRESGQVYWGVYEHLQANRPEWVRCEVLLFDTRSFRERAPSSDPIQAVAFHGNASLLRGSGLREMIWIAGRIWPQARGRLDVEYNAELTQDELILHYRFDPENRELERVPLQKVYRLDVADAAGGRK